MSWNMHDAVRGAITAINDDTPGTVYVSAGRVNVRGILTPLYNTVAADLQVQAKPHKELSHERALGYTSARYVIYAYGNFADVERPDGKGGDVCGFNNQFWYISSVLEWWPEWCAFEVTRQLNAADIATLLAAISNGQNIGYGQSYGSSYGTGKGQTNGYGTGYGATY
ncbi:head protein [Ralstonia phage PQ43W]